MPDLKSVLAWSAVAAGVAIAAERRLSRSLADPESPVLDWELVRRTAYSRCGGDGMADVEQAGRDYDPLVAELVPMLAEACHTSQQEATFGRVRVVGRHGFIDQNLGMMRRMLRPIEERQASSGLFRPSPLMRIPSSLYVGTLLGFMARRVLGQYDPVLTLPSGAGGSGEGMEPLPAPALLIVEPNVRRFSEASELPLNSLRRWLMLHELTHAWQFELHPWLREYLGTMIGELSRPPGQAKGLGLEELVQTARSLRPQLVLVGRVQAVMTVLEGHGNYVMREAGRRHFPDFDTLDEAFRRRHDPPQAAERLLLWVSGIAFKLQQYQQGERFLRTVNEAAGQEGLDRIWSGSDSLPGWSEVRHPEQWLQRTGLRKAGPQTSSGHSQPVPA
ncbi:MAG TPA: zinc-dependent metalloprotease [Candidatus Dormibacteraeota bacterium]|nr:zinc-dependent metalloprotease [Candidatus Dormibacteraeota bacterium]